MNGFIGALAAQLTPAARYRPQPTALPRAHEMHSQASGGGDMLTLCVPRCLTMAIFCPDVPQKKRPRTGKGLFSGNISPPCIQNELALAGYARHVSEKFCKSPLEDTLREYLARKGPFSLHKPLESCTARRSCHDSAFAGLAHGRQEEPGIASALRIAADGPTTVIAHV